MTSQLKHDSACRSASSRQTSSIKTCILRGLCASASSTRCEFEIKYSLLGLFGYTFCSSAGVGVLVLVHGDIGSG
jgi:hypothetical protein